MANIECNPFFRVSSNQQQRQQQLFCLVSQLCAPRHGRPQSDVVRLIVDSRLAWQVAPIDGQSSWLYLPQAVSGRSVAGCLVLSAD